MKLWNQLIIVIQTVSIIFHFQYVCWFHFSDSQTAVQTNGVGLFGSGSTGVGMFGSGSTVPDSVLQQAPTPRDSQYSLSLSQVSIATQDIENAMLEINFGNPLNNLNK